MEELANTRVERKPKLPKIYRIKKYVINETTPINVNHLLRCLPFPNNERLCTIRKAALYTTLKNSGCKVRKTHNIKTLMDTAKEHMKYDIAYKKLIKRIIMLQTIFRKYLANFEKRLRGPGIPTHRCINDTCPYLLSELKDLSENDIITWKDKKIYGCSFVGLFGSIHRVLSGGRQQHLYEDKFEHYQRIIDDYEKLTPQRRNRCRHRSSNPFVNIRNPFTRNSLPPGLFRRALHMAKYKKLLKPSPKKNTVHESQVKEEISNEELIRNCLNLSEYMQTLEFYTPADSFSRIIQPLITFYESRTTNPVLLHRENTNIIQNIVNHIIPFYDYIRENLHNQAILRAINHDPLIRTSMRRHLPRQVIRNIHSFRSLRDPGIPTNPVTVISMNGRLRLFTKELLKTFYKIIRIFNASLSPQNTHVEIENKKSIAIIFIIGLVNTNNLEGFEWARDMDM